MVTSCISWHLPIFWGNQHHQKITYILWFIHRRHTEGCPIVFTYALIFIGKRILDFQFVYGKKPFWNHQNVLLWWDGRDGGTGRSTKVSFNFLHILWVYRTCIGLLTSMFKNCHQLFYGFENLMSSWRVWILFSKL